jgi:tetratricopeptide (TPR) repeat protein/tRNA A-37 threonylcarbamoyl transferase component Bud32
MSELRERLQATLGEAYTLERELGGGGMSRVFVADETALGRKVVVKVLPPDLAAGVSVDRFKREIQMAARLQHPHIVPVLSAGEIAGLPYYTMPFVDGSSLRARLAQGPLPISEAVGVLKEVARALAYAHEQGVVHRDIKPDNVLLTRGSAVVTDFGIAKALSAARVDAGDSATLTALGTSLGTPAYMAPEQGAGDPGTDHRADLYAFGCMAYELLSGEQPFHGRSPHKLMAAHMAERPQAIAERRLDTPPALAALVMQCLEKEPEHRPQSAADVARVLDSVTSSGTTPSAPAILAGRIRIGRALALWAAATAVVLLTAWAAMVVIGLPDWVLPGAIGVMLAGLPIIGFTAWVQRVAHRTYTATPTFTPGGTASTTQGTLHTLAIKASPHVSWRRTWMGGAVAVGAFVVLVVGWMVMRALGIGPSASLLGAGKLGAGDQIILTDFKSPADDSTLGVTVAEALRADLSQSSVLRVLPRLVIIDVLRLMRRAPDSRIDFDLARTIASREGLKAVLDGDIVSLGGRYILSTRLIATDGSELATFKEEAESENDLIPAIGRLGKQLRAKAGESLKSVREAGALDRVTTSSMDALRNYVAGNRIFDQTSDYQQAMPLLEQSVAIDSTFAMAWRRLSQYYSNTGRLERARDAATRAFQNADRLGEVERQLTIATYYSLGRERDTDKALVAYEAALARDSLNIIALNNAALEYRNRRESDKAFAYMLRAVAQPGATVLTWGNTIAAASRLKRWSLVDSLQEEFRRRFPTNPTAQGLGGRALALRFEFDSAEARARENAPRVAGSRTAAINNLGFTADLATLRGRVREALASKAEQRRLQMQGPASASARLTAGFDSVATTAMILEDRASAKGMLDRALRRAPIDSIPYLDRDYGAYLAVAAMAGDTARAREWYAEDLRSWEQFGKSFDRPGWEAMSAAMLAVSRGRYSEAKAALDAAERAKLWRTDILSSWRFYVLDRLQETDSALAVGEAYLTLTEPGRVGQDAFFLASTRQRLGEMYEAKGNVDKALEHYTAFVELWKNADPELQPRVRDVRGRIERLQRRRG